MPNWKAAGAVATILLGFGCAVGCAIFAAAQNDDWSCTHRLSSINGSYAVLGSILTLIDIYALIRISPSELQFYHTYALGINLKPLPGDPKAYTNILPGRMTSQQRIMHDARLTAVQNRLDGVADLTHIPWYISTAFLIMSSLSLAWGIIAIYFASSLPIGCGGDRVYRALRIWTYVAGGLALFNVIFQLLNFYYYRPISLDLPEIYSALHRALNRHKRFRDTAGETWSESEWSSDYSDSSDWSSDEDDSESDSDNDHHHHRNNHHRNKRRPLPNVTKPTTKKTEISVKKAGDNKKASKSVTNSQSHGPSTTKLPLPTDQPRHLTTTINPPVDSAMVAYLHRRAAIARGESVHKHPDRHIINIDPHHSTTHNTHNTNTPPIKINPNITQDPNQIQPVSLFSLPLAPEPQIQPVQLLPILPDQQIEPAPIPEQLVPIVQLQRRKSVQNIREFPIVALPIIPPILPLPHHPINNNMDHDDGDDHSDGLEYTHESLDLHTHDNDESSTEPQKNDAFDYPNPRQQKHRRSH